MKALTLHQPWAGLVAVGAKRIETRSWSTDYRGSLAIHAGKQTPPHAGDLGRFRIWRESSVVWWLDARQGDPGSNQYWPLTFGAVVATCTLADVVQVDEHPNGGWRTEGGAFWNIDPYGDFTPGRYAWLLDDIVPLSEPAPARGRQGLWNWESAVPLESSSA